MVIARTARGGDDYGPRRGLPEGLEVVGWNEFSDPEHSVTIPQILVHEHQLALRYLVHKVPSIQAEALRGPSPEA